MAAPPDHPFVSIAQLQSALNAAASFATIVVVLGLTLLVAPKAQLIWRLRSAEGRAKRAEDSLEAWSATIETMRNEIRDLRDEVRGARTELTASRTEAAAARLEVATMRTEQGEATLYLARVILHFRRRGSVTTMPEPPASIKDAVLAEVSAREAAAGDVVPATEAAVNVAAAILEH